jgi:hypothetical protein
MQLQGGPGPTWTPPQAEFEHAVPDAGSSRPSGYAPRPMPSIEAGSKRTAWPPRRYALAAMNQLPTPSDLRLSSWRRRLIVTAAILAVGGFVWSQLPKGSYPTDLTRIGQGQAALVLAIDSNYSGGASVMELLNDVRHDFADSVQFLVASLALPSGQAFADRHQASDGTVLLFDAKGQRVAVLHTPQTQDELRKVLQQALGL